MPFGFDPEESARIVILVYGATIGVFAAAARSLMSPVKTGLMAFIGGLIGSAVAAFSFGGLMVVVFEVDNLLVLSMAGPIGWIGGDVLASIGRHYLREAGIQDPGARTAKEKERSGD